MSYSRSSIFLSMSVIILSLIILTSANVEAAKTRNWEALKDPIFDKPFRLIELSRFDDGVTEFKRIAAENEGTDIGATALIFASRYSTNGDSIQILNQVIDKYPNTRYWMTAKKRLIAYRYDDECDALLKEWDAVYQEAGGASIFKIINGQASSFKAKSVPEQFRNTLADSYFMDANGFHKTDPKKEYRILHFVREKFPKFEWEDAIGRIQSNLIAENQPFNWSRYKEDKYPPHVLPIYPLAGQWTKDKRPRIIVELWDGDVAQTQVNLGKTLFKLDGQDITEDMEVKSIINRTVKPGSVFELLTLTYRPENPLGKGRHSIYIKAYDYGGKFREKKWSFYVR